MVFSLNALFATVASIAYVKNASINYGVFGVVIAGVIAGSLLPDIDEPESYIGKRFSALAEPINKLFGHRGASHYLIVPFIIFVCAAFLSGTSSLFLWGLGFGYLFHILGDMMTLGGVYNALFPFGNKSKKYAILPKNFRFKTNSYPEHLLRAFLGALLALQAFKLYTSGSIH